MSRRRRARANRTLAPIVVAVAGLGVAIAAGIVAGHSLAPEESAVSAPHLVELGAARVVVPAEWQRAPLRSAHVPGLDPHRAAVFAPYPGISTRVIAMVAPAADASLIPGALRDVLRESPPHPLVSRLARWPAWRYAAVLARDRARTVAITVMPTTRGVVAVACLSPAAAFGPGCTPDVDAVSVQGAVPLTPSPSVAFALRLPAALGPLDRARVAGRAALHRAHSPAAQAAIARRLARAYSAAAASLPTGGGAAARPLAHRLVAARRAYARLSAAARNRSVARFNTARGHVRAAEAGVAKAIARIRRERVLRPADPLPAR